MKDSYVILEEYYNQGEQNISWIEINTHLGTFLGSTCPDEVDAKYLSQYHASEICLAKALRKFSEAAISLLKREIKLLEGLVKQSVDGAVADYDIDNNSFRLINGTLKQKRKELILWQNRVDGLTKRITDRVAARDKIVAGYVTKDKTE
jgi:hypothetical protein